MSRANKALAYVLAECIVQAMNKGVPVTPNTPDVPDNGDVFETLEKTVTTTKNSYWYSPQADITELKGIKPGAGTYRLTVTDEAGETEMVESTTNDTLTEIGNDWLDYSAGSAMDNKQHDDGGNYLLLMDNGRVAARRFFSRTEGTYHFKLEKIE